MNAATLPVGQAAGLSEIMDLCNGEASFRSEGGRDFIYMQGLRFLVGGAQQTMDALLCLNHTNPTYPTKLYLAEKLGAGLNWNEEAYLFGRQWFTFSWKDVPPNQPYIAVLAEHLAALNQAKAA